jgi:DNA polymerase I
MNAQAVKRRPIIVDGNSLLVRCIMASAKDDLRAGVWTGGMYGFISSLSLLLTQLELQRTPAGGVFVFMDSGVPSERKALIPTYKEDRAEKQSFLTDEEKEQAYTQIPEMCSALPFLGVLGLAFKDREADDGVAAAVRVWVQHGFHPVVVSGDKDLFQTVLYGADVWYLNSKELVTVDNFEEQTAKHFKIEKGIKVEAYVTFRALSGDKSDSIPGVPGIGPARAAELITGCADTAEEFYNESPERQILEIVQYIRGHEKPPSYYSSVLAHFDRLLDVANGIDLRSSFGGTAGLAELMRNLPDFQSISALRWAKKHNLNNIITDQSRYLQPFARARQRFVSL